MPASLKLFERLAYLSVFANIAIFAIENASPAGAHFGVWVMIALAAATVATAVVFISVTVRYRINWLRWLYASMLLISVAGNLWLAPAIFANGASKWIQILTVCCVALNVACVYLLLSRSSSEWFRSRIASGNRASA